MNYRSSGFGPWGGNLIFWSMITQRLPLGDTMDDGFHLGGPVNWAGGEVQVEMMVNTVQEGCQAIVDTIMERELRPGGQGASKEQQRQ